MASFFLDTDVSGSLNVANNMTVGGTLLVDDVDIKTELDTVTEKVTALEEVTDVSDMTVTFENYDAIGDGCYATEDIETMSSGSKLSKLSSIFSRIANNVKWLVNNIGTTDLTGIGDGTVTGAVSELNDSLFSDFLKKTDIVDNLSSTSSALPLSANQGRILNNSISSVSSTASSAQSTANTANSTANSAYSLASGRELITYGTNSNGAYYKFSNGTLICTKTLTFTSTACTVAWGSMYESNKLSLGSWAYTFSAQPTVSTTICSSGTSVFIEGVFNGGVSLVGDTIFCRPTSMTVDSVVVNVVGIGRWK